MNAAGESWMTTSCYLTLDRLCELTCSSRSCGVDGHGRAHQFAHASEKACQMCSTRTLASCGVRCAVARCAKRLDTVCMYVVDCVQ